ncbi:MAG: endonuclease V [Candidatus Bathyarchaeota archaeon]|nr:endonuclease V [Candidatus Bathyarchaeota archaeon]MDH5746594.1 endonuclease V [Candidatus Bathyarchaeota archaeon]
MSVASTMPNFSIEKAHETQLRLSKQIVLKDVLPKKIHLVAGVDAAYMRDLSVGAVVVLDYTSLEFVESQTAFCKTRFPYVPTLLSFREMPPTVLSIKKLRLQPDIFLVDAHGFAHPYRCGFASHLGLVIGKPTIGVAKSRLFGKVEETRGKRDAALLKHNNEVIGAVVTTTHGCKPVYVSVGHMVSLETAVKIVRHCTHHNRIPEPILKAHELATAEKRKINIASTVNR